MNSIDILHDIICHPVRLFGQISHMPPQKMDHRLILAFVLVLTTSLICAVCAPYSTNTWGILFLIPYNAAIGVAGWLVSSLIFALGRYAYTQKFDVMLLLTLTAYALTPWLLLPIVYAWHWAIPGLLGQILSFTGLLALSLWTTWLFILALKKAYELTFAQLIALSLLPFLMAIISAAWIIHGSLSTLIRLS